MSAISTTKISSKGQVVIPEDVSNKLKLSNGSQFVVMGEDDVVILKVIQPPSMDDFDGIIKKARKQAKGAGLNKADITEAIRKVRGRK